MSIRSTSGSLSVRLVVLTTAPRDPMQFCGVLVFHLQITPSIAGGRNTDRRPFTADPVRFHEQLEFAGVDVQHGIVVGQLPRVTIGGPATTNEPNIGFEVVVFFVVDGYAADPYISP